VNWNYPVSVGGSVRNGLKAALLAAGVIAAAGVVFYFGTVVRAAKTGGTESAQISAKRGAATLQALSSHPLSLPMFFEPNQGQTDAQVKFLARGAGYGLFLTGDEAVLELQQAVPSPRTATAIAAPKPNSWIRMKLAGANASARVSGISPLPGKSNYFIGDDRSKWRSAIPQFARVQYEAVYPGVDLVYYGSQGQLEYDFRVAPGADPNQIALNFAGASAHIVPANSADAGDLVLSTANGDIRFHAPHVYQPATPGNGSAETTVAAGFRQLADNKIGFATGDYDHSRELVIDPILTYSTYLGAGGESLVKVAIDASDNIYLAGSTTSAYFFPPPTEGASPPLQNQLGGPGAQNLFIAVINPTPQAGFPELLYATYLGGSGTDSLAGIAVDSSRDIYVSGTTTSTNFPNTPNAFETTASVAGNGGFPGTHGFLSAISLGLNAVYSLTYSTYLAGNGVDTVTGLAIDNSCISNNATASCNAYVTGVTTSQNGPNNGFTANPNGYQFLSNSPGNAQFFASKLYTAGSGFQSMLYSTYFGGGNFGTTDIAIGGGIAVDPTTTSPNMYFTGTTNMLGVSGNGGVLPAFPLFNAQQSCLNEASKTNCSSQTPTDTTDAFAAKINPNQPQSSPIYSTYLGGSGNDYGYGIAVDTTSNAYVVGATSSDDWTCLGCPPGFQTAYAGTTGTGNTNGFIAKVGNIVGSTYPLNYFTWLGGSGPDNVQDIKVDSTGSAHVVGTTFSSNFPIVNALLPSAGSPYNGSEYSGAGDAFVALISTTMGGTFPNAPAGDYSSYLGGSEADQGTGVALDVFGAAYVAGTTRSTNYPVTAATAYQPALVGTQNAFVSKIGASSILSLTVPNNSPTPNPVAAGNQITFTFNITNTGTDDANLVVFDALGLPTTGLTGTPFAQITSGSGSCNGVVGSTISCSIPSLTVNSTASIQVNMTPAIPVINSTITISGIASANGGPLTGAVSQPLANVVDFQVTATVLTPTVNAGDTATIQVNFCPISQFGYNATITPSQTSSPSMVTAVSPTFNPTPVTIAGTACGTTTLSIATVARPVNGGSLFRRGPIYAAWLPIGGLSLLGVGIGASRKRRRWLIGLSLFLLAGVLLLQPGCGAGSSAVPTTTGTQAGTYTITITGSAGGAASHNTVVFLQVD
jgi:hypothetical protein